MKKNQRLILISVGIFICVLSQIFVHFTKIPDFAAGGIMGIGIGIMILSFINKKGLRSSY